MNTPEYFQMAKGYGCYRPEGRVALQEAIDLVSAIIAFARDNQIKRLFVDVTQLTGFGSPTTFERFGLAEQFASAAQASVKVALLVKSEMIDPARFGVTVARNRGLLGNVFASETEAVNWLMDPDTH